MDMTYKELKEYNNKYIINGRDVFGDSPDDDQTLYSKYERAWDYCDNKNIKARKIFDELGYMQDWDYNCFCNTETYCAIYEFILSLPEEEQVTLVLMGLEL